MNMFYLYISVHDFCIRISLITMCHADRLYNVLHLRRCQIIMIITKILLRK